MAKIISEILLKQIRRAKPLLHAMDIETSRRGQDALGELGARTLRDKVVYAKEPFENFEADWALPLNGPAGGIILYLHGGSYTAGSLSYSRGFGGVLADNTACITLCIGYRLAPEHPFPAALDDATEAYVRITEKYPSQQIAIVGESAGGGLSFALAVRLKDLDLPQPKCIVALSPWTDLTCSSPCYRELAEIDPCLFEDSLKQSAEFYSLGDTKNPLVSPLFADLAGLPPTLIYAGTAEILLDDSVRMAEALDAAGVFNELHIVEDMWHAYVLYGIPEAKDALSRIEEFVSEHLTNSKDAE